MKFLLAFSLYVSAGSDLASTRYAINRGSIEGNPIYGQGIKQQALVSFGTATAMLLIHRKMEKTQPKIAGTLVGAYIASRAAVSIHNVKTGNREGR